MQFPGAGIGCGAAIGVGTASGVGAVCGDGGDVGGCCPEASTLMSAQFQNSSAHFPLSGPQHFPPQSFPLPCTQAEHQLLAVVHCAAVILLKYEK